MMPKSHLNDCYPIRNNGGLKMLNNTFRIVENAQAQQYMQVSTTINLYENANI
jgi:hypothetical protein